jgi:hypothetical protein
MNYIVFDAEGRDWKSTPEVFSTLEEAQARLMVQNERFANGNPFVVRQIVEVTA